MAKTFIDWANCKAINGPYWEFFNISFNIEKLQEYANEKWYVNLTMSKRKEVWQYWDTHYFTLNEWTPKGDNQKTNNEQHNSMDNDSQNDISVEDIPF